MKLRKIPKEDDQGGNSRKYQQWSADKEKDYKIVNSYQYFVNNILNPFTYGCDISVPGAL